MSTNEQEKCTGSRLPLNRIIKLHREEETQEQRSERLKNEFKDVKNEQNREYYQQNAKKIRAKMKRYRKEQKKKDTEQWTSGLLLVKKSVSKLVLREKYDMKGLVYKCSDVCITNNIIALALLICRMARNEHYVNLIV